MALDIAGAAAGAAPAPAAAPAAEAYGVTKWYGATTALLDAGIVVQPGETHALVGRNGAGKSTLVAVLTGLLKPDAGEVRFDGQPAPPLSDRDAWRQRAACVYQKSTIIPDLTVAENLFINRQARHGLIDWRGLRRRAADVLGEYGVDVDPRRLAGDLTVEQRQLVEIARALSFGARFIILDEPTAQLDAAAINRLFTRMQALRAAGVTFLFISHHLQEVYQVCQTVTVFRDARHILTRPVAQLSHDALVEAMTGEAVALTEAAGRSRLPADAPVVLNASGLSMADYYEGVDLQVRAGELVGVIGSGSSGKVALAETMAGQRAGHARRRPRVPAPRPPPRRPHPAAVGRRKRDPANRRPARSAGHRGPGAAPRSGPADDRRVRHQDRRPGAAGERPVRRQRPEGRAGTGAGQPATGARADQPDRRGGRAVEGVVAGHRDRHDRRRHRRPGGLRRARRPAFLRPRPGDVPRQGGS